MRRMELSVMCLLRASKDGDMKSIQKILEHRHHPSTPDVDASPQCFFYSSDVWGDMTHALATEVKTIRHTLIII